MYRYVVQLVVEFENGVATVIEPGTASDPVAVIGTGLPTICALAKLIWVI